MTLYNEIEPYAVQWLQNLTDAGHLPEGRIDDRPIQELEPDDIPRGQPSHFFCGIGGWPLALRLAGWPDEFPVWTGSCPCQPFSVAGKGLGVDDERHLWPVWRELIREHTPSVVAGEQVASPAGRAWLASVRTDLEQMGYAVGAADLPAASVGAPHIRQRLFFAAARLGNADGFGPLRQSGARQEPNETRGVSDGLGNADGERSRRAAVQHTPPPDRSGRGPHDHGVERADRALRMADPDRQRQQGFGLLVRQWGPQQLVLETGGLRSTGGVADGDSERRREIELQIPPGEPDGRWCIQVAGVDRRATRGFWARPDWHLGRDGSVRPSQPGAFPLADGVPGRVGKLRAYGNAIVPQVAAEFLSAFADALGFL